MFRLLVLAIFAFSSAAFSQMREQMNEANFAASLQSQEQGKLKVQSFNLAFEFKKVIYKRWLLLGTGFDYDQQMWGYGKIGVFAELDYPGEPDQIFVPFVSFGPHIGITDVENIYGYSSAVGIKVFLLRNVIVFWRAKYDQAFFDTVSNAESVESNFGIGVAFE